MRSQTILLVDDDAVIRSSLKEFLENHNYKVCESTSLRSAVRLDLSTFCALIVDTRLPDGKGTDLVKLAPDVPVIVTCARASLRAAVETMKMGAADYLAKPYDYAELARTLAELIPHDEADDVTEMLGQCHSIDTLLSQISKVAPTETNVLIEGESGTGKELVAQRIHALSQRAERQMISLNCAAIPDAFIESELFGHEKGAFNGATTARVGLVEAADGSTLFLDEIGELPLEAQGRLLRVLQEREVRRVGAVKTRNVSIRLIASTHRNLQKLVNEGAFREDLFYRLNVVRLALPPLRERGPDVLLLARHFLTTHAAKHGKSRLRFSDAASHLIETYHWPGNIRELENAVQRAVILCEGKTIKADLLAIGEQVNSRFPTTDEQVEPVSLEEYFVKFVLDHQDEFTETELAQKLGISRKSLWQKRQKLGIPRERGRLR
ncbi:MAG: sigma-54 dependent transcriptional regulator [Proteobacteria bacterium]|nr:sigma-54 dependent transcriptional regulator [Pseudomonadota bacterium]